MGSSFSLHTHGHLWQVMPLLPNVNAFARGAAQPLLLCFANGGMLGDVFLHILPETLGGNHGSSHNSSTTATATTTRTTTAMATVTTTIMAGTATPSLTQRAHTLSWAVSSPSSWWRRLSGAPSPVPTQPLRPSPPGACFQTRTHDRRRFSAGKHSHGGSLHHHAHGPSTAEAPATAAAPAKAGRRVRSPARGAGERGVRLVVRFEADEVEARAAHLPSSILAATSLTLARVKMRTGILSPPGLDYLSEGLGFRSKSFRCLLWTP